MKSVQDNLSRYTNDDRAERVQCALYQLGSCMAMGLGWTHFRSGNLSSAESDLLAGQTLLRVSGEDILRRAYADLLLGSVYRARAGTQGNQQPLLNQAIGLLKGALRVFEERGHILYRGRANCSLAIAFALTDQPSMLREGIRYATKAENDARVVSDWECCCQAYVANSRIHSKIYSFEKAMLYARLAEQEATRTDQDLALVEALIAQGEVCFSEGQSATGVKSTRAYRRAIDSYRVALRLGEQNPRQVAVCNLHLARTHLKLLEREVARRYFEEFSTGQPQVENGYILATAKQIRDELYPEKDVLVLDIKNAQLSKKVYTALEEKLRRFLINRVQLSQNREEAIQELGISRQTYYTWKRTFAETLADEESKNRENRGKSVAGPFGTELPDDNRTVSDKPLGTKRPGSGLDALAKAGSALTKNAPLF
jgi:hypothetical protein